MTWRIWLPLTAALLVLAVAGLVELGAMRWAESTRSLTDRLQSGRLPPSPSHYDPQELEGLPAPVQRYFRAVLTPGQAIVTGATVEHTGQFNLSTQAEQWAPFVSHQTVTTRRPGFLWDARIAMMPGITVRVHDGYVDRAGLLHAAVHGLINMADLHGGGELARGELMRFFAEAAWYPTALLPSQGVRWEAVDDRSARGTLTDGPISLTLLFRFDDAGLMASVRAEARGRMEGKTITMAPWEGRWSNPQQREGMTVPFTGEVAWMLPDGPKTYWRGTITKLRYEWKAGAAEAAAAPAPELSGRSVRWTPDGGR